MEFPQEVPISRHVVLVPGQTERSGSPSLDSVLNFELSTTKRSPLRCEMRASDKLPSLHDNRNKVCGKRRALDRKTILTERLGSPSKVGNVADLDESKSRRLRLSSLSIMLVSIQSNFESQATTIPNQSRLSFIADIMMRQGNDDLESRVRAFETPILTLQPQQKKRAHRASMFHDSHLPRNSASASERQTSHGDDDGTL